MQLSYKKARAAAAYAANTTPSRLAELQAGDKAILDRLDLPEEIANRLMELGFLPGSTITATGSAPGGDPRVFRVDGAEIALRLETAAHLHIRK